jgi:antitoxin MazE
MDVNRDREKQTEETQTEPKQNQAKAKTEPENGGNIIMPGIATTVQKWGNSLAVRIPSTVAEIASLKQGSEMEITVSKDRKIELKPKKKVPTLEELVSRITPENRHAEVDFGKPEGNELW